MHGDPHLNASLSFRPFIAAAAAGYLIPRFNDGDISLLAAACTHAVRTGALLRHVTDASGRAKSNEKKEEEREKKKTEKRGAKKKCIYFCAIFFE